MTEVPEGSAGRILVVEDEPSIRLFYERFLRPRGYEVHSVPLAEEARELILSDAAFDAILLDVQMPGIGGLGLWKFIRQNRPDYENRVIFITGDVLGPRTLELLDKSGRPYLFKPFDNRQLLQHLEETVEASRKSRESGGQEQGASA